MDHLSTDKVVPSELIYETLFRPILAKDEGIDAEKLSELSLKILSQLSIYKNLPGISLMLNRIKSDLEIRDNRLQQQLFGCHFSNPLGLAAGFDKNGVAAGIWDYFGFGFAEVGTVTWHSQTGNKKPRLFRLAKEKAALNRMGFNNKGAKSMRNTLERQKIKPPSKRSNVIGINLGKSKITALEEASNDYAASLEVIADFADYVVINVSSPNTPGLRSLQNAKELRQIIHQLQEITCCPPLLVKIAPDLENSEIDELGLLAKDENLAGIIAVNTSINRLGLEKRILSQTGLSLSNESGGISGEPLRERANEVIRRLYKTSLDLPLIGVGGISTPESAWERMTAGASLLQLYTGWIFEGPILVPKILKGLLCQLDRHGFKNISEAIGSDAPWI